MKKEAVNKGGRPKSEMTQILEALKRLEQIIPNTLIEAAEAEEEGRKLTIASLRDKKMISKLDLIKEKLGAKTRQAVIRILVNDYKI